MEAFRNLICLSREKKKLKVCWTSMHNQNWKFSCILYAHSQFLCPFYAQLLIFDKISAQALTAMAILPISVAWSNCCTSSKIAVVNIEAFMNLIMSQQGKGKIHVCWTSRPVTSFGHHTRGAKSFLKGGHIFLIMSNTFKIRPTRISCGGKNFSKGASPLLVTGLWTSIHHKKQKFACVLYPHSQFLCTLAKFDLANQGVRQPAQPHTSNPQLLVFDET